MTRNTPVQFLHRLIWIHLPNTVRRLDDKFTGGRLASSTGRLGNYLFYEKHPLVLVSPPLNPGTLDESRDTGQTSDTMTTTRSSSSEP